MRAVDGVSLEVCAGETLGIVGESACGKTVTATALLRLSPDPPGRIVGGRILFDGKDLLTLDEEEMRRVRGRTIAMVFQEPMSALNPVFTVGRQAADAIRAHQNLSRPNARRRAVEMLAIVGILDPGRGRATAVHTVMYVCLCQAGKRGYSEWVVEIHEKELLMRKIAAQPFWTRPLPLRARSASNRPQRRPSGRSRGSVGKKTPSIRR